LTQDDKGRKRWTFFGASEQGPFRSFWKSFFTSGQNEIQPEKVTRFIQSILNTAYGESCNSLADLLQIGFRILQVLETRKKHSGQCGHLHSSGMTGWI